MRSTCFLLAAAALASSGVATAIGTLAPWWPSADIPNQFTPFILAVAVAGSVLLAFAAPKPARERRIGLAVLAGLAAVAVINAGAVLGVLATAASAAKGQPNTLTVVSFNVWSKNKRLGEAIRWLADAKADAVILQEMTLRNREPIKTALATTYPYVHDCGCNDIVMFSRQPWLDAGGQPRTDRQPAMSWLTLADHKGLEVRVAGVRTRYIVHPIEYAAHYDWLARHVGELGSPTIVAGDFNAAPWSWQMMRLTAATGLRRHGTYAASWPSRLPVVLIDNMLSTPDIKSVSFRVGPALGSDHLPVIATVALP